MIDARDVEVCCVLLFNSMGRDGWALILVLLPLCYFLFQILLCFCIAYKAELSSAASFK